MANNDTWSVFDVMGPVMIGPSSSHTGGACKLGYLARMIFGTMPEKVTLRLHGSFGEVYEGHYTDVALIGGLLKMLPSNGDIPRANELAKQAGMEVTLEPCNLGAEYHPNTVEFVMEAHGRTQRLIGASIGGGKVEIQQIDKVPIVLTNSYSSLLVCYENNTVELSDFLAFVVEEGIPVLKTKTWSYKDMTILDIETKEWFEDEVREKIEQAFDVLWVRHVNHISHYTY